MPESRNGCAEPVPAAVDVARCSAVAADAAAAAAALFLFALCVDVGAVGPEGASALIGVSDTLVDDADDDDADDVGLRQVTGRGDGWPICDTVLHKFPSGGIFA